MPPSNSPSKWLDPMNFSLNLADITGLGDVTGGWGMGAGEDMLLVDEVEPEADSFVGWGQGPRSLNLLDEMQRERDTIHERGASATQKERDEDRTAQTVVQHSHLAAIPTHFTTTSAQQQLLLTEDPSSNPVIVHSPSTSQALSSSSRRKSRRPSSGRSKLRLISIPPPAAANSPPNVADIGEDDNSLHNDATLSDIYDDYPLPPFLREKPIKTPSSKTTAVRHGRSSPNLVPMSPPSPFLPGHSSSTSGPSSNRTSAASAVTSLNSPHPSRPTSRPQPLASRPSLSNRSVTEKNQSVDDLFERRKRDSYIGPVGTASADLSFESEVKNVPSRKGKEIKAVSRVGPSRTRRESHTSSKPYSRPSVASIDNEKSHPLPEKKKVAAPPEDEAHEGDSSISMKVKAFFERYLKPAAATAPPSAPALVPEDLPEVDRPEVLDASDVIETAERPQPAFPKQRASARTIQSRLPSSPVPESIAASLPQPQSSPAPPGAFILKLAATQKQKQKAPARPITVPISPFKRLPVSSNQASPSKKRPAPSAGRWESPTKKRAAYALRTITVPQPFNASGPRQTNKSTSRSNAQPERPNTSGSGSASAQAPASAPAASVCSETLKKLEAQRKKRIEEEAKQRRTVVSPPMAPTHSTASIAATLQRRKSFNETLSKWQTNPLAPSNRNHLSNSTGIDSNNSNDPFNRIPNFAALHAMEQKKAEARAKKMRKKEEERMAGMVKVKPIGVHGERREEERRIWEEGKRVRDAEIERQKEERRKQQEEIDRREIAEERKRTVIRAHPVPAEIYH